MTDYSDDLLADMPESLFQHAEYEDVVYFRNKLIHTGGVGPAAEKAKVQYELVRDSYIIRHQRG